MSKQKRSAAPVEPAIKRRKVSQSQPDQVQPPAKNTKRHQKAAKQVQHDEESPANLMVQESPSVQQLPSVKDLASSEWPKRRAAFASIKEHLKSRPASSQLSRDECLQVWRGLFVAIYMHDSKNPVSVQNFLADVADTFSVVASKDQPQNTSWLDVYHRAFHETLVREWASIDSHRMNKYLLLVRLVMRQLFKLCFQPLFVGQSTNEQYNGSGASLTRTRSIMEVLQAVGPLNCTDRKIADGLRLHLLDILPDEVLAAWGLAGAGNETDDQGPQKLDEDHLRALFTIISEPLHHMSNSDSGAQKHVRARAREAASSMEQKLKFILTGDEDDGSGSEG